MRGRDFQLALEFGEHRFDGSVLTWRSDGRAEYWSIDVPAVMWMLDRIATGDVDALSVRDQLCGATQWNSGCCGECDRASAHYDEARARHEVAVCRWEQLQVQLDEAEYPYLLNKRKIHSLECQRPPRPAPPLFPEDLHMFAVFFDSCGQDLDVLTTEVRDSATRSYDLGMGRTSGFGVDHHICTERTGGPGVPP